MSGNCPPIIPFDLTKKLGRPDYRTVALSRNLLHHFTLKNGTREAGCTELPYRRCFRSPCFHVHIEHTYTSNVVVLPMIGGPETAVLLRTRLKSRNRSRVTRSMRNADEKSREAPLIAKCLLGRRYRYCSFKYGAPIKMKARRSCYIWTTANEGEAYTVVRSTTYLQIGKRDFKASKTKQNATYWKDPHNTKTWPCLCRTFNPLKTWQYSFELQNDSLKARVWLLFYISAVALQ